MRFAEVSLFLMAIFSSVIAIEDRGNRARTINYRSRVDYRNRISTSTYERGTADTFATRGTLLRGIIRSSTSETGRNDIPKPYSFDYKTADEDGNMHYRKEEADASGAVRGSYGYTDIEGLYRIVDYVADSTGFHVNIKTNEPGVGGKGPADVNLIVSEPPVGIQEKYKEFKGTGPLVSRTRGGGNFFTISADPVVMTVIVENNYPDVAHHITGSVHGLYKSGINSPEPEDDDDEEENEDKVLEYKSLPSL